MNVEQRLVLTFFVGVGMLSLTNLFVPSFAATVNNGVKRNTALAATKAAIKPRATVALAVPFHRQQHSLSCEIASLKSALQYKGVDVSEGDLIARLSFDSTPKQNGVWGNPQVGFVGNIDGKMPATGYGVYWGPIADVANMYRPSEAFTNGTMETIVAELDSNNPVIVWAHLGAGTKISWKTSDGQTVRAVLYEHTRVVVGYTGSRRNPTGLYVLDPVYGKIYQSTGVFMRNWSKLGYSGVMVR